MYSLTLSLNTTDDLVKVVNLLQGFTESVSVATMTSEPVKERKSRKTKSEENSEVISTLTIDTADTPVPKITMSNPSTGEVVDITPIKYEDVKKVTTSLAKISRDHALEVLAKFRGIKLANDLKEEEWGSFVDAANKKLKELYSESLA